MKHPTIALGNGFVHSLATPQSHIVVDGLQVKAVTEKHNLLRKVHLKKRPPRKGKKA